MLSRWDFKELESWKSLEVEYIGNLGNWLYLHTGSQRYFICSTSFWLNSRIIPHI